MWHDNAGIACPTASGAKDWEPSSYSPRTELMYIPHENICMDWESVQVNYIAGTPYVGANVVMKPRPGGNRGELTAWDVVKEKPAWAIKEDLPVWSGTVATAGDLVFYGTMDGWFKAIDAHTGKLLWQFKTGSGIIGQPVAYRGPDGREYIAVLSRQPQARHHLVRRPAAAAAHDRRRTGRRRRDEHAADALAGAARADRERAGYMLYGNYKQPNPPAAIVQAVELAGYFAAREAEKVALTPLQPSPDGPGWPMAFDISMGLRKGNKVFLNRIDRELVRDRVAIDAILTDYHLCCRRRHGTARSGSSRPAAHTP